MPAAGSTCASFTDAYAPVRNQRCIVLLITLYVFSLFLTVLFQARINALSCLFSWKSFMYSLVLFASLLPIVGTRLTTTTIYQPILPSTAAEIVSSIYRKHNWYLVAMYIGSSLAIIRTYFGYLTNESYTASLLIHPQGLYSSARQVNTENIFIYIYAIALGASYAVKRIIERKDVLRLPPVQVRQCTRSICFFAIKASIATVLRAGARWAWRVFKYSYVFFVLFNSSVVYHYAAQLIGLYTKVLDTPLVGFRWLDAHLFFRMIMAGCLATCSWELVDSLFEIFFAAVAPVTMPYVNQFECLLSGLQLKKNNLLRALAYAELAYLSSKDSNRRKALFRDIYDEVDQSAWTRISRECIQMVSTLQKAIESEYTGIQQRSNATPTAKPTAPSPFRNIELVDKDVFAAPVERTSMLDDRTCSLLTNGAPLSADDVMWVEEPNPTPVLAQPPPFHSQRTSLVKLVTDLKIWKQLNTPTLVRKTRSLFTEFPVVLWAIEALGNLTAASFHEDVYGFVQHDIGTVLDCLLGCLLQVEELVQNPPPSYRLLAPGFHGRVLLNEPQAVLMALRKAIYEITVTFKDYPERFKVQKKHEPKLRQFLHFHE